MPYQYRCSDPNYSIYVGIDSEENDLLAKYGWTNDVLFHVSNLSSGHIYLRTPHDTIDLDVFKKVKKISDFFKLFKIPINVIEECLHLTKLSSIKGSKLDSVNIDITPWLNVEKVQGTAAGTIHFKNMKYVTVLNVTYNNNQMHAQQKQTKKKKKKVVATEHKANADDLFYDDFIDDSDDSNSNDEPPSQTNIYNKKKWKKKLKALEKTKEIIDHHDAKNVEKYLMEQQLKHNESLQLQQKENKKKLKKQQKKEKLEKKKKENLKNYVGVFDYGDMTSNQNMAADFEDTFMISIMQAKHKKRLIITLQLKNAEVYPGSNLHGTVILQLMQKHRCRTSSIESIDVTPKRESYGSGSGSGHTMNSITVIERVSVSVTGICNMNESIEDRGHFPSHLESENDEFNILNGKQNILGNALQLSTQQNESIQFDFVVQLPPVLPCSYCGFFIQYLYFAQLYVSISAHVAATTCRVPFYVLPSNTNEITTKIPHLLTPKNLQERMSVFRVRKKQNETVMDNSHNTKPSGPSPSLLSPSLLLSPSDTADTADTDDQDHDKYSYFLRRNSLSLSYRDSNDYTDEFNEIKWNHNDDNNENKFRISLDNCVIAILLLNETRFCDGQCIEGYLSLFTPCIVRVTLIHIEECGDCEKQKHETNCCSYYQCCWFIPSFTFNLKIPNNAFKSFKSDLCQSSWTLNFEFGIAKHLLQNKHLISYASRKEEETGYLNVEKDVWKLYDQNNNKKGDAYDNRYEIDKILNWQLPIIVTTMHNPLRCVTRSTAVVVKC